MRGRNNMIIDTEVVKKDMEDIQDQWDGDKPGRAEERAMFAKDIQEKAVELEALINQLYNDDF